MAEKSSRDQANIRQKLSLVWRNGKKISQIIIDYFYLPFFLLFILWSLTSLLEDFAVWAFLTLSYSSKGSPALAVLRWSDLDIGLQYMPNFLIIQFLFNSKGTNLTNESKVKI